MRLLFNSAVAVGTLAIVHSPGARALTKWAGHCSAGAAISGNGVHETSTKSVEDLNLDVKMELQPGVSLGGVVLDPDSTTPVVAGENYFLTIDGSDPNNQQFKGFLFRLSDRSGGGANVANDIVVPGNPDRPMRKLESEGGGELGSQSDPPKCAEGVAGVCHSNAGAPAAPGFQASIDFKPSSAGELLLEVTVVVQGGANNWGFSAYNFTVDDQPSSTPSSSPSSMPTSAPSSSPPTSAPSSSPSSMPSSSPSSMPSVSMAPSPPPVTKSPVAPTSGGNTIANKIPSIVAAFSTGMAWLCL